MRMLHGCEVFFFRVAVTRPLAYSPDIPVTRYYGPYIEKGQAAAQGRRAAGKAGTYAVQRVMVTAWETERPATWEMLPA